jgi:hypothetical protein
VNVCRCSQHFAASEIVIGGNQRNLEVRDFKEFQWNRHKPKGYHKYWASWHWADLSMFELRWAEHSSAGMSGHLGWIGTNWKLLSYIELALFGISIYQNYPAPIEKGWKRLSYTELASWPLNLAESRPSRTKTRTKFENRKSENSDERQIAPTRTNANSDVRQLGRNYNIILDNSWHLGKTRTNAVFALLGELRKVLRVWGGVLEFSSLWLIIISDTVCCTVFSVIDFSTVIFKLGFNCFRHHTHYFTLLQSDSCWYVSTSHRGAAFAARARRIRCYPKLYTIIWLFLKPY